MGSPPLDHFFLCPCWDLGLMVGLFSSIPPFPVLDTPFFFFVTSFFCGGVFWALFFCCGWVFYHTIPFLFSPSPRLSLPLLFFGDNCFYNPAQGPSTVFADQLDQPRLPWFPPLLNRKRSRFKLTVPPFSPLADFFSLFVVIPCQLSLFFCPCETPLGDPFQLNLFEPSYLPPPPNGSCWATRLLSLTQNCTVVM